MFRRLDAIFSLSDCGQSQSLKLKMASKRRNMFYQNKEQETTEIEISMPESGKDEVTSDLVDAQVTGGKVEVEAKKAIVDAETSGNNSPTSTEVHNNGIAEEEVTDKSENVKEETTSGPTSSEGKEAKPDEGSSKDGEVGSSTSEVKGSTEEGSGDAKGSHKKQEEATSTSEVKVDPSIADKNSGKEDVSEAVPTKETVEEKVTSTPVEEATTTVSTVAEAETKSDTKEDKEEASSTTETAKKGPVPSDGKTNTESPKEAEAAQKEESKGEPTSTSEEVQKSAEEAKPSEEEMLVDSTKRESPSSEEPAEKNCAGESSAESKKEEDAKEESKEVENKTGEVMDVQGEAKDDATTVKSVDEDEKMEVDEEPASSSEDTTSKEEPLTKKAKTIVIDPLLKAIMLLVAEGKTLMKDKDYAAAADTFGQACEKGRELFGEMGQECAELFCMYAQSMLECGKVENGVFGTKVNLGPDEAEEEEEEEEAEEEEEEVVEEEGAEKKKEEEEEKKPSEETKVNGDKAPAEESAQNSEEKPTEEGSDEDKKADSEDTPLRVAWEMFELAKVIYLRQGDKKKAAEMYMKLGEVGVESGHPTAIDDMKSALELRKQEYPEGHRIIAETHFHIGLGHSFFQNFDEAVEQFDLAKQLLLKKVAELKSSESAEAKDEMKEIEELIPELDEKIADMVESKREKQRREEGGAEATTNGEDKSESSSAGGGGQASNISHLVKRKRKLDEVTSDLPVQSTKQVCLEEGAVLKEEGEEAAPAAEPQKKD